VFSPMHGWWEKLTRKEIWAVIQYIREIAPYRPQASGYYL
jgi:mono/diheme cytochrome c family protein